MSFKDDLQKLAIQIIDRKIHITNEEMTKQSLIIPFIQVLGYDVFNPLEVRPEYTADFGKKKGEKVDYAIFKDDIPIMFIEAKAVDENLDIYDSQLARYFNSTPEVKLAILTDGVNYRFFTDLDTNNMMDENPFATVNITDLSLNDIEILTKFKKEYFEAESLVRYAEDLIYTSNLINKLRELFKNPSDDFIRYLIKDFSDSRITSNVIDRFRPIVKKSISNTLLDIVSKGIFQQEVATTDAEKPILDSNGKPETEPTNKNVKEILTTEDEIKSFDIIKNVLESNGRDVSELQYKDTMSYFGIFTKNANSWFIRIYLETANKYIIARLSVDKSQALASNYKVEPAPKGHGENSSRIYIESISDLNSLDKLILECYDEINKEKDK